MKTEPVRTAGAVIMVPENTVHFREPPTTPTRTRVIMAPYLTAAPTELQPKPRAYVVYWADTQGNLAGDEVYVFTGQRAYQNAYDQADAMKQYWHVHMISTETTPVHFRQGNSL